MATMASTILAHAQPAKISVDVSHPMHAISPTLWGVFFEDINMSTDGGIYPELVRNRSFEDADTLQNWTFTSVGEGQSEATVVKADVHGQPQPLNAFDRSAVRVTAGGAFTLQNEGYWGMNILDGDSYRLKFAARMTDGFRSPLTAKLIGTNGQVLASGKITGFSSRWKYYTLDLTATGSDPKAKLEISGAGKGALYLDMVSLMPEKTWKDHGLRLDLAESLDALHPKFLRFPGGCWVEGDDFAHMNHWKSTIGDIDVRTPLWNIWGYNATQGMGYYEYLQLAEDLGAEPLFCINVGMSHKETVPLDRMSQWVQDAVDAVEYANGPTNSTWGAMRAAAGHPAPFNLKYMEIGNENGGPDYVQRWPLLINAIHAKYPYVQFIANTDLRGRPLPKEPVPDIVDEHYYESPESFMRRADQYDKYDRNGPKIFIGEYAVTKKCGKGNLRAAIGEAAFMTGMERNSDVVVMASYAPLLVNLNHRAWNPDLINFDSSRWYGLPSYYVQQMFSENRGDEELPVQVETPSVPVIATKGMIGVGTWNTSAEFKDIKVTAPDGSTLLASDFSNNADGWKKLGDGDWSVQNGSLRQTAEKEFVRALAGDETWTDYTLTLKARKIGGREGFLILFHISNDEDRIWWNLGGWDNTQNGIESGNGPIDGKPGHIETGQWYDVKVVVSGKHVKCYLDGQLIHDVDYDSDAQVKALYACAAHEERTGDIIVKVVNTSASPIEGRIDLSGAQTLSGAGQATELTSGSGADENSIDNPMKVSPRTESMNFNGTVLTRTFPGNSFTVLRLNSH